MAMRRRRFLKLAGMAGAGLAVVGSRLVPELGAIEARASDDWTSEALSPDATEALRLASFSDSDANRLRELVPDALTEAEVWGLRSHGAGLDHDLVMIAYRRPDDESWTLPSAYLVSGTGTVSDGQLAGTTYPVRLLLRHSDRSAWSAHQLQVARGADDDVTGQLLNALWPLDTQPSPSPSPNSSPGDVGIALRGASTGSATIRVAMQQQPGQPPPPLQFRNCYAECFGWCATMVTAGVVTVAATIGCALTWWTVILTPVLCGAAVVGAVVTTGSAVGCVACRLKCEQFNAGLIQIQQQQPPRPPVPR